MYCGFGLSGISVGYFGIDIFNYVMHALSDKINHGSENYVFDLNHTFLRASTDTLFSRVKITDLR